MPYCRPGSKLCRNGAVRVDVLLTALWSVEKARRCSRKFCNAICVFFVLFLQSLPLVVLRRVVIVSGVPSITFWRGFPHFLSPVYRRVLWNMKSHVGVYF
uniref:Uncharacterized protein n=1 Tax=Ixodes ricinus TaxID=34613 RepID=A0A6B0UEH3_IXORI